MTFHTTPRVSLLMAMAIVSFPPLPSRSAESAQENRIGSIALMDRCREMNEQRQKMQADVQAGNVALREQIATMTSAPADQKVDLMAALLASMVEQRISMDARQVTLERDVRQHVMKHMEMGRDSASGCPMMQGLADTGSRTPAAPRQLIVKDSSHP